MGRWAGVVLLCIMFGFVVTARAHDFPPPAVKVTLSSTTPGGHPDLLTTFDVPTGPGFDQIRVVAPPGSSVASDAEIPDGTIVGRLDAEATTNAITLPDCTSRVVFTVPIRKETADASSSSYPAYLRNLAPGQHRLRLVADVSPSPTIPVLINYLVDIDPVLQSVVTLVFVGDPTHPPQQFVSCTPEKSTNTLYGVTPAGVPLLTLAAQSVSPTATFTPRSPTATNTATRTRTNTPGTPTSVRTASPTATSTPAPPTATSTSAPNPRLAFEFSFTSRPDANGQRHVQNVETIAAIAPVDHPPLAAPMMTPAPGGTVAAGSRLDQSSGAAGFGGASDVARVAAPEAGSGQDARTGFLAVAWLAAGGVVVVAVGLALRRQHR